MSTKLVLVLVLLFSFVLGRFLYELRGRLALPSTAIHAVVGLVLGPLALGVLDDQVLAGVQPVLSLLLGLVGFGKGLLLRRQLPGRRGLIAGAVGAGAVIALVTVTVAGGLYATGWRFGALLWPALAIGGIAAVIDDRVLAALADRAGAAGPSRDLLRTFALSSSIVAVCAFGLSLALARADTDTNRSVVLWLLAAPAAGVACGLLFRLFTGPAQTDQRLLVGTVGILALVSGVASATGTSPLLAGLVAGMTASFVSDHAEPVGASLEPLRTPALIGVMILAGAMWAPPTGITWLVVLACVVARLPALRVAGWLGPRVIPGLRRPHRLGAALLPQGGLGVAIAVNFAQVYPGEGPLVLTVALLGAAAGDLLGHRVVRRVLADAGEVAHRATRLLDVPS